MLKIDGRFFVEGGWFVEWSVVASTPSEYIDIDLTESGKVDGFVLTYVFLSSGLSILDRISV